MTPRYQKGDRVRISEYGLETAFRKNTMYRGKLIDWRTRLGTVASSNRGSVISVVWDGNRPTSTNSIHCDYIRKADQ